jgi:hypothetical protein
LQASGLTAVAKGKALIISGELLKTGTWVGLDNVPTTYSQKFLENLYPSLPGKPIRFAHQASPESMTPDIPQGTTVGFWTRSRASATTLEGRGYIFDPRAIAYLKAHPNTKLSVEANCRCIHNGDGSDTAISGTATGGALIDDPACKSAEPIVFRTVTLERGKHTMSTPNKEFITFDATGKNTKEDFSAFLKTELAEMKVPEATIASVIETIGKVEKPFKIAPPATEPLPAEVQELMAYAKESKKPFAEAMKEFSAMKFNQAGNDPEKAQMKTELEALRTIVNQAAQTKVTGLVAEIKTYDQTFDSTKLLEGVKDIPIQTKMLESYLAVLKTHAKPIALQLSPADAESKVTAVAEEMFGDKNMTVEKILGRTN